MLAEQVSIDQFLQSAETWPVLDVRSPSEFRQGHLPGAISFPLFDDQQRATVGIAYKHNGHQAAVLKGLELVGPRMREMAETGYRLTLEHWQKDPNCSRSERNRVLVHCWRGGMRSRSVSWLMEQAGLKVTLLEGGYKSYRRYVLQRCGDPLRLVVLSGMTGAGKTQVLHHLASAGQQVIDLEGLANHRGSAFGYLGPQPTVEQFENNLVQRLDQLDPDRPVWIEDEAQSIGRCAVPGAFFRQYRKAPAVFLDVSRQQRSNYLAMLYGDQKKEDLSQAIREVRKRLGGQHEQQALADLQSGDLVACADRLLEYYDKAYLRSQKQHQRERMETMALSAPGAADGVPELIRLAEKWVGKGRATV